ncbi:hypothetical protein GGI42DRAFT_354759 [Trichoderma sp. SZMC 28013]
MWTTVSAAVPPAASTVTLAKTCRSCGYRLGALCMATGFSQCDLPTLGMALIALPHACLLLLNTFSLQHKYARHVY